MKTLVINGATRPDGDTQALLDAFLQELSGETMIVSRKDAISPCIDCRRCWTQPGCAINDDMQSVYRFHEQCDNIVIASPIWYSSLSGPALNILSRMQSLFAARFRRGERRAAEKNGVLILVGAQPETKDAPLFSALTVMRTMQVK
ncbi:MAG: flavodoxin family protein, partial [Eubacteriales bacterium]|nr:flavodoxin family protein [Eubacteriales bacterium]